MKIFQVDDRGRINLQQVKDLPVENCKFLSSRSALHHQSNTRKRNVELHFSRLLENTERRGAYAPSRCYVADQGSITIKFINIHQVSPLPVIHVRYSGYFIVKAFLSIKLIFLLWIDSLVYFHKKGQKRIMRQRGKLKALAGICEFHLSYF